MYISLRVSVLQRIESRELGQRSWLGRDIFAWPVNVTVTLASGATSSYDAVNIRQIDDKTGLYTKKGVFLRHNRWAALKSRINDITNNLTATTRINFNLGGGVMGGSGGQYRGVSLRRFWRPTGLLEVVPTRKGIELTVAEWARFVALVGAIEAPSQALQQAVDCALNHDGQREAEQCVECHPFDL